MKLMPGQSFILPSEICLCPDCGGMLQCMIDGQDALCVMCDSECSGPGLQSDWQPVLDAARRYVNENHKAETPTRYVLGFLFREDRQSVVLIRKQKPAWQAGLLNGIGGKVEAEEPIYNAMVREFREETGVDTMDLNWRPFAELSGDGFLVHCFTLLDTDAWQRAETAEHEEVEKHNLLALRGQKRVSNLLWLVELALDLNGGEHFFVKARYSSNSYSLGNLAARNLPNPQPTL